MGIGEEDLVSQLSLPPGFRFFPTDEELLVHYLCRQVAGHHFSLQLIGEIDLYKFDPWVLPSKATFGEKEWYFFSPRDRKYPNGSRPNRVAGSGYWKATGTDKIITTEGRKVGIKKALVFYVGKAPKGTKTNWIMHEYRLSEPPRKNGSSRLDDWVLCRIYKKSSSTTQKAVSGVWKEEQSHSSSPPPSSSQLEDVLGSLPEIDDQVFNLPRMNSLKSLQDEKLNIQNSGNGESGWSNTVIMGSSAEPVTNNLNHRPEPYFPSISPLSHVDSPSERFESSIEEEELESRVGSQPVESSSFFQQNWNMFPQTFSNQFDPFGNRSFWDYIGHRTPTHLALPN